MATKKEGKRARMKRPPTTGKLGLAFVLARHKRQTKAPVQGVKKGK